MGIDDSGSGLKGVTEERANSADDSLTSSTALARPHHRSSILSRYAMVFLGIILVIVFAITVPTFFTVNDFSNMAIEDGELLLLAVGATVPLLSGDFDLSVPATMLITGIILSLLATSSGLPLGLAIVIAIAASAAVGVINGLLVVTVGLDSFVATLAVFTALSGVGYGLTKNTVLFTVPTTLVNSLRVDVGPIPVACILGWVVALALAWLVSQTPVGRRWAFIGGNREAARLVGLPVQRLRILAYVVSAVISGFAGIVLVGLIGSVDPSSGQSYILTPFAAAFLGTTVGKLGRFNILGTVISLYVLTILETGLVLAGAPSWISDVFDGAALVVAMAFAKLWRARAKSRQA